MADPTVPASGSISFGQLFNTYFPLIGERKLSRLYAATPSIPSVGTPIKLSVFRGKTAPRPVFTLNNITGTNMNVNTGGVIFGIVGGNLTIDFMNFFIGNQPLAYHRNIRFTSSAALPAGMTLNTSGIMVLTNTMQAIQTTRTVTATNGWNKTADIPLTLNIVAAILNSFLATAGSTTTMNLSWTGTYSFVRITWSPGSGDSGYVSGSSTTINSLTANTSYTFTITPFSSNYTAGETYVPSIAKATWARVSGVSASAASSTSITVSWMYDAWTKCKVSGRTEQTSSTSQVVTGLSAATSYQFTVIPYNIDGIEGSGVITNSVTTFSAATITSFTATSSYYNYAITSWVATGASSYNITNNTNGQSNNTSSTSYGWSTNQSTQYSFTLIPYDAAGVAGPSSTTYVTTPARVYFCSFYKADGSGRSLPPGSYDIQQLTDWGLQDNIVTIEVEQTRSCSVYQDAGFSPSGRHFSPGYYNLTTLEGGVWANRISSIIVNNY